MRLVLEIWRGRQDSNPPLLVVSWWQGSSIWVPVGKCLLSPGLAWPQIGRLLQPVVYPIAIEPKRKAYHGVSADSGSGQVGGNTRWRLFSISLSMFAAGALE